VSPPRLDEILTVNRLGVPAKLRRSLACTNSIENMMGTVRRVCRNVKRWRNALAVALAAALARRTSVSADSPKIDQSRLATGLEAIGRGRYRVQWIEMAPALAAMLWRAVHWPNSLLSIGAAKIRP
jgi:hypothetical protein